LLISVHCNDAGNGDWLNARGWSAYTSKGQTKADKLADCLYSVAESVFVGQRIRKDLSDGDPDWEENFYILNKTKCPAVLTENFFQDNKDDVAFLLSPEGKQQIVKVHVEGIIKYLENYA
ncbi:N-acetylmuramoyl-L-alanine amidase, partial [Bacteroides salyersiae]|uniref:N-acetylmuramoyl-L-alanine amidase n=1 Tax=Bacteroides salyersiae TaxID=291644 RepID=UPI001230B7B2